MKYVFMDFPLPMHGQAMKASEAALCAGDQDKFWEMHDRLFANQNALSPEALSKHAEALGLDTTQFKECLDSGAMFLEHVFNDVTRQVAFPITQKKIAEAIRAIGAKYILMSTDAGQWLNPIPAQSMGIYIKDMLDLGISEDDVRMMVQTNPARMLGL